MLDVSGISSSSNFVELLRDGVVVGSRLGAGAVTDPGPVPAGTHVYTARQTDALSHVSPLSSGDTVTVVTKTPSTPAALVLNPADDSGVKLDGITNVKQPRLVGSADPLTLVQLVDSSGNVNSSTMTASDGTYSLTPSAPLADGSYAYRVREEDVAGNLSAASAVFNLVILATLPTAPNAPTLWPADDSGVAGDNLTNVRQPRLFGIVGSGVTIQIVGSGGAVLGSATVGTGGSYTVAPASGLADGVYALKVQVIDVAGNVSALSPALTITIDATPPAAPPAPSLLPSDATGGAGATSSLKQPHLIGTAEPGSAVQLVNAAGTVLGSGNAQGSGSYSIQFASPLADGTYLIRAPGHGRRRKHRGRGRDLQPHDPVDRHRTRHTIRPRPPRGR